MKSAASLIVALAMTAALGAQTASQLVNLRHWTGQGVAPVYEGFDINRDGSYNMWFGYMNRNYEEAIELPVGADNTFQPGGDRGQPTHFVPRRHKDVFSVRVPSPARPKLHVEIVGIASKRPRACSLLVGPAKSDVKAAPIAFGTGSTSRLTG